MELERLAREGGKELRDRWERELIVDLRLNYKLFKCTNKDRLKDEGCGSWFQMHVKLNYDRNQEVTTCDAQGGRSWQPFVGGNNLNI